MSHININRHIWDSIPKSNYNPILLQYYWNIYLYACKHIWYTICICATCIARIHTPCVHIRLFRSELQMLYCTYSPCIVQYSEWRSQIYVYHDQYSKRRQYNVCARVRVFVSLVWMHRIESYRIQLNSSTTCKIDSFCMQIFFVNRMKGSERSSKKICAKSNYILDGKLKLEDELNNACILHVPSNMGTRDRQRSKTLFFFCEIKAKRSGIFHLREMLTTGLTIQCLRRNIYIDCLPPPWFASCSYLYLFLECSKFWLATSNQFINILK